MLTSNYYLYCGIILAGIGTFIAVAQWVSHCCFGYAGRSDDALLWTQRILSLSAGALWLAFCFHLYLPAMRDLPQLLSGNYSVAEGIVTRKVSTPFTIEDYDGNTMEFKWVSESFDVEEGSYVELSYLDNSRAASLLMENEDGQQKHSGKLLFGMLAFLMAAFINLHAIELLGNREFFQRKQRKIFVYTYVYEIVLSIMTLWVMCCLMIIVAAMCGKYNAEIADVWAWIVCLAHVTAFPLFILGWQRIEIKDGKIVYKSFNKKYIGSLRNIAGMEMYEKKSDYMGNSQVKRMELKITLTDRRVLLVNDMEVLRNQVFYEKLREEVNMG